MTGQRRSDGVEPVPGPVDEVSGSLARLERRVATFLRDNSSLFVLVIAGLAARFFLADWNSYWFDELLSVDRYGRWNASTGDVVRRLADGSVHPPLYQVILFNWMQLFGVTETATRMLSNLYIAGATVCVYFFVARFASRRVAFTAAVTFTLMYAPTYFALETRSYSQTIFLVCLSTYLLARVLGRYVDDSDSSRLWRAPALILLTLSNVSLLLTHYYNAFFWATQALFAFALVLRTRRINAWRGKALAVAGSYFMQIVLFLTLWGSVLLADYRRRSGSFRVNGELESPWSLVFDTILQPNLAFSMWGFWVLAVVAATILTTASARVATRSRPTWSVWRAWWHIYLVVWLLGPILVATAVFGVTGVARYNQRYFLYCMPALAPLLVISIFEVVKVVRLRLPGLPRALTGRALFSVAAGLVILVWVVPGAHTAATQRKHDWRGVVSDVVQVVESNPQNSYVIVEAASRVTPMSNHYFERLSESIEVEHVLLRREQELGRYRILAEQRSEIEAHDRLIVVFLHSRTEAGYFPEALSRLRREYGELHRQLRFGRGYVLFDLHPSEA